MNKQRQTQLCIVSVIIASLCLLTLYIGAAIWGFEQSKEPPGRLKRTSFMALPASPHCGHLYNHPGNHRLWAECMGVGYDRSKTDRYLFNHRNDD